MVKIELSNSIKELHLQYCKKHISFKKDIDLDIDEEQLKKINNLEKKYTLEDIKKVHNKFIDFCKNNLEEIAIGNPNRLKEIITTVKSKYRVIDFMLEKNIAVYIDGKLVKYSDVILKMYNYEGFTKFNSTSKGFLYRKEDKNIIFNKIKNNTEGLSDSTINEFVELLYDRLNIKKEKIIKRIEENKFYTYWNAYTFVFLIDLKTCPYCNRQYITPIFHENGRMRADLDHFFPKSKYPYLSMSIYNLIPCCKFCNSSLKGKKEFDIDTINPYESSIDDYIKFKYEIEQNNKIDIKLENKNECEGVNIDKYIDIFKLEQQYKYHTNIVDELICRKLMYSDKYIEDIRKYFEKINLYISSQKIKEIAIGYITDNKNINKEPLSKLKRDVVNQMNGRIDILNEEEDILKDILRRLEID